MPEPRIQYAKTTDGVNIAYYTAGEGMPFVSLPVLPACHLQLLRQIPAARNFDNGVLAVRAMHVRYDPRGFGLSDRDIDSFNLDAMVEDLHAVIQQLALPRVILYSVAWACPIALAYAARYPERVWRLVLQSGTLQGADVHTETLKSIIALASTDWRVFCSTIMNVALGWSSEDDAGQWASVMRESITAEEFQPFIRDQREWDASDRAGSIRAPTLVLHQRDYPLVSNDAVRRMVVSIPNAELFVMDGDKAVLGEEGTAAMMEFLGAGRPARQRISAAMRQHPSEATLRTILFTDLVSSTALTQRLGDAKAQELVRAHNAIVREALAAHGGSEVKHTGDGIMASFPTASGALECAVAIQRGVADWDSRAHGHAPLQVHIGLNAGEPVAEESDLFGTSVQLARRICDHASAGQILVSNVVRELSAGKGFLFSDIGEVVPKGFEEPVRLYEVRWREAG